MVLEGILKSKEVRKHPFTMLALAMALSSIGIIVGYYTFPEHASILGLALVTIGMMPILHTIFVKEETEEATKPGSCLTFIERHFDLIKIYAFFFIGLIISYSLWYVALPVEMRETVFSEQEKAIEDIGKLRTAHTGQAFLFTGPCGENYWCWFDVIFANNAMVLLLAILLSFIYGVGAIFLIAWNASVLAVVIGKDMLQLMAPYAAMGVFGKVAAYFHGLFNAIGFIPHGMPEIIGYFVGAIAGGIISVAISKGKFMSHEFTTIAKDALVLILIALLLLFFAALIEAGLIIGIAG
jgi:hypothetical protein